MGTVDLKLLKLCSKLRSDCLPAIEGVIEDDYDFVAFEPDGNIGESYVCATSTCRDSGVRVEKESGLLRVAAVAHLCGGHQTKKCRFGGIPNTRLHWVDVDGIAQGT